MRNLFDKNKGIMNKLKYETVYNKFKEKGFTLTDKEYKSNQQKLTCVDEYGYKYSINFNNLKDKIPEKFNKFNPYTIENLELFLKINSNGSKLITDKYIDSRMTLKITCEDCGKVIEKKWGTIINNDGNKMKYKCKNCINNINDRKCSFDFIKRYFKDQGLYITDNDYNGNSIPLNCVDKNGYKVKISYSNLKYNKSPNIFSLKFNKDNYIYNINNYFKNNNINCIALRYLEDKFISNYNVIICKCECGKEFGTSWSSIKDGKIRCEYCSKCMSNMEFKVRKWLDDNNIKYEYQKRFDDCKVKRVLPFDFYLPDFNCVIEIQGEQHYKPTLFSEKINIEEEFKKRQEYDEIKRRYCKENNIELLEISYLDIKRKNNNYKEILSNKFIKK